VFPVYRDDVLVGLASCIVDPTAPPR